MHLKNCFIESLRLYKANILVKTGVPIRGFYGSLVAKVLRRRFSKRSGSYLVAGRTAWFEALGVVPTAVQFAVPEEVDKVHQQLLAHAASEAARVPAGSGTGPGGEHAHVALGHRLIALKKRRFVNNTSMHISIIKYKTEL